MTGISPEKPRDDQTRAAEQLVRIEEKILQTWESRVRSTIPAATGKSRLILRNMVPDLIKHITSHLLHKNNIPDHQRVGEIGKEHGEQRSKLSDYSISQVFQEYRILRQVIFELLEEEKLCGPRIRNIILDVIDEDVQKAIVQFADLRSRELELTNRDLENFAAVAAHDLKSPLATISGYLVVLQENLEGKICDEDLDLLRTAKRSAAQMTLLIDRLLEYASAGRDETVSCQFRLTRSLRKWLGA